MTTGFTISNDFNRYGGDADRKIYLMVFDDAIHLGIMVNNFYSVHLSSQPEYITWLLDNKHNLMMMQEEDWYDARQLGYTFKDDFWKTWYHAFGKLWELTKGEN